MMLVAQALALLGAAWLLGSLARRAGLPDLLGMIVAGALVAALLPSSPATLDLDDVASAGRLAVLAVVLLRAGLGIRRQDIRAAGTLALRLGVLPVFGDMILVAAAAVLLFDVDIMTGVVAGCLVGAVSPAIVIPGMIDLLEGRTGPGRRVPTALLAGAPIDNVLAVVALGAALDFSLAQDASVSASLMGLGWSLGGGIGLGLAAGFALLGLARLAPWLLGSSLGPWLLWGTAAGLVILGLQAEISFVLAILAVGFILRDRLRDDVSAADEGLTSMWNVLRYLLFGLIGAAVDLGPVLATGLAAVAVVLAGQVGRAAGSLTATARSGLSGRERLACVLAYVPKASMQAAFAALALDRGHEHGGLILTIGVLAIVLTAPVGVVAVYRWVGPLLDPREATP